MNTCRIREQAALLLMWRVLEVWAKDETGHGIPLSQSLTQSRVQTPLSSVKAERREEAAEERLGAPSGWSGCLREEAVSTTQTCKARQQVIQKILLFSKCIS